MNRDERMRWLGETDPSALERLWRAADDVRREHVGDAVHLRALVEFSNRCGRSCSYCGVRRGRAGLRRYRMSAEEILDAAGEGRRLGLATVVLQSGEDPTMDAGWLADVIERIKAETGMAVTLSVGERDAEDYALWRRAGADRFLLRFETSNPDLYDSLHGDAVGGLEARLATLRILADLGYEVGSGVMVGLPGQTAETLARDVIWLHELGAEMIGVGPFIPHPATPLKDAEGGTVEQTLRLVAVLRLVFPDAHLPATTAMGSLHQLGRERALQAGANVVMPNVTPTDCRPKYEIYPGKICLGDDAGHCRGCVTGRIHSIGRTIGTDHGHVKRVRDTNSSS